jgi:hypothetical protein
VLDHKETTVPPKGLHSGDISRARSESMFQQLTQQVLQTVQATHPPAHTSQDPDQSVHDEGTEEDLTWPSILEDLLAAPPVTEAAWSKLSN